MANEHADSARVYAKFNEERRYQHRLYEMHYNTHRPHQGLEGETPLTVYQREYPLHATTRMLGAPPVNMAKGGAL